MRSDIKKAITVSLAQKTSASALTAETTVPGQGGLSEGGPGILPPLGRQGGRIPDKNGWKTHMTNLLYA